MVTEKRSTKATTTKSATRKRTVEKVELVEESLQQEEQPEPQTDPRLALYLDKVEEPATEEIEPLEDVPPSTDFEFGKQWVNLGLSHLMQEHSYQSGEVKPRSRTMPNRC